MLSLGLQSVMEMQNAQSWDLRPDILPASLGDGRTSQPEKD